MLPLPTGRDANLGDSGQLYAYRKALEAATGQSVEQTMIFFPVSGRLVEVALSIWIILRNQRIIWSIKK